MKYIENDPEMLQGGLVHPGGKARINHKWESLSFVVNAADRLSAQKNGKGWRSVSKISLVAINYSFNFDCV